MAAPGPATRHQAVRSTAVPHESFRTPTSKSRQLCLFFCLPGFLSLSCLPVNHSGDVCKPWGMCLFWAFLLNQTLLPKTSDEALCLPLGKIFMDFKTSTLSQLYDYQVAEQRVLLTPNSSVKGTDGYWEARSNTAASKITFLKQLFAVYVFIFFPSFWLQTHAQPQDPLTVF